MKKFVLIIGTRPEIIKVAPFIRAAENAGLIFSVLHTGQHYSQFMDRVFWQNFGLRPPKYNLKVRGETHAEQVGKMMIGIENFLLREKPDFVMVYADVNTALAGALVARKLNIPIIHLEGGLRSFDMTMPEEVNRVLVSHISDYHFVPHRFHKDNLHKEGIKNGIFVVGNTIADAIDSMVDLAKRRSGILERLDLIPKKYLLMTIHRPACVDNRNNLLGVINGVKKISKMQKLPVIFPIHPRTQTRIKGFRISLPGEFLVMKPLDYFDFLQLETNAKLILSDSGGIQEEACILKVPLITLRENTERPETVDIGSNILAGFDPQKIESAAAKMLRKKPNWRHPYGHNVSKRIAGILKDKIL